MLLVPWVQMQSRPRRKRDTSTGKLDVKQSFNLVSSSTITDTKVQRLCQPECDHKQVILELWKSQVSPKCVANDVFSHLHLPKGALIHSWASNPASAIEK